METESYFSLSRFVKELSDDSFDDIATWRLKKHKCSIVLFYTPWCPHCINVKEMWGKLGNIAAFFDVCAFNCEKYKGHLAKIKEDMPYLIQGYPTIIIYNNGEPIEEYNGDRNLNKLVQACMRSCKK